MTCAATKFHNVLIIGGEHADRLAYAEVLAKSALCLNPMAERPCESCHSCRRIASNVHPNLLFVRPICVGDDQNSQSENALHTDDGGIIKIEQVRRIIGESHKANFEKGISVVVITHMHKITKAAANAMLKMIEESHASKMYIALAPSRMAVLPTIASRLLCRRVQPKAIDQNVDSKTHDLIVKITRAKPKARFLFCGEFSSNREEFSKKIDELMNACHLLLRNRQIVPHCALKLGDALADADKRLRQNLNPRLVAETLILRDWPFFAE